MKETFIQHPFKPKSLKLIAQANGIIDEYSGYKLTLRQLYYQFVARDIIPNTQKSYKALGAIINLARLSGMIDWDAIEDRTRNLDDRSHWDSPQSIMDSAARSYAIDKWDGQTYRVEVWIEKEALVGVIERICKDLDVDFFACRGYVSQSEQYTAGKRLADYEYRGQVPVIIHLGDHDPSGMDMTRDNDDRISMFAGDGKVIMDRIALNMDQIQQHKPPPNPAKITDSRFAAYVNKYGNDSWELDALDPKTLRALIQERVEYYRDDDLYNELKKRENDERYELNTISRKYERVRAYANIDGAELEAQGEAVMAQLKDQGLI